MYEHVEMPHTALRRDKLMRFFDTRAMSGTENTTAQAQSHSAHSGVNRLNRQHATSAVLFYA